MSFMKAVWYLMGKSIIVERTDKFSDQRGFPFYKVYSKGDSAPPVLMSPKAICNMAKMVKETIE